MPDRDRQAHGSHLLGQIEALKAEEQLALEVVMTPEQEFANGLQLEFEGFPGIELAFEKLDRKGARIELLNVRREGDSTSATVFVPEGKLVEFERLAVDYLSERRTSKGKLRDNRALINTIREIKRATLRQLWTDDPNLLPASDEEQIWWEVWLPIRGKREQIVAAFKGLATGLGIDVKPGQIEFPERTVLLAFGTAAQMKRSTILLGMIAELRRAKETADFFDDLPPGEQAEWVNDLLARTTFPGSADDVPHVCLIDTGVTGGHPLIEPALDRNDMHTVEPGWGTNDSDGHGTEMAGLALFGSLVEPLASGSPIRVANRLESVKLLPSSRAGTNDPELYGNVTLEAVSRPEVTAPDRRRLFSMAITPRDGRDRGRPSSWSAAVDRIAADSDASGENPRLLIIAAGNVEGLDPWGEYPSSNETDGVHDPGQSWNALTVGSSTHLVQITEPDAQDHRPIAESGGLSPFSCTSFTWRDRWPYKPDILLEGGNVGRGHFGPTTLPSLSLLTTHRAPIERFFTTTRATSASTALAARMAARIMADYPAFWPETVRGLLVHSSDWSPEMRRMFLPNGTHPTKTDYAQLVRRCGFGIPSLEKALWSASNSLTMISQEKLQPFLREPSKDPRLRDMHLHRLPWPTDVLESLGATSVRMRVTLSYFIEPNPSARGFGSGFQYASHGLRFDVKRPHEEIEDFRTRINVAARDEEESSRVQAADAGWAIGPKNRHRGSLHSDIWEGTAVDLASRGALAVYPTAGWWKSRPRHERYNRLTRYSLLVSIEAPEVDVDIYSQVASQIRTPIEIRT